jgi:hypothetical protein
MLYFAQYGRFLGDRLLDEDRYLGVVQEAAILVTPGNLLRRLGRGQTLDVDHAHQL